ncbi:MAG: DNA repair protein RecO [Chloroflexi bacterium]|nr:DNA repair protein RecO [Chloroflexota bacterium]
MAVPHLYRTEAIVLKRVDMGEADKILTLYTPTFGKLRAIAKGARRPTSKLGGHVDLFMCSRLQVARGRDLDIVTQSEIVHAYPRLREDLYRTTYAFHIAELLDNLTGERIENQTLYDLLLVTLERLDTEDSPEIAARAFEVQALGLLGYRPELHRCLRCGAEAQPVVNYFSAPAGGLLCPDCGGAGHVGVPLSVNALKVLRVLQAGDFQLARRLRLTPGLRAELESVLRAYLQFVLERRLRSVEFLNTLRREGVG